MVIVGPKPVPYVASPKPPTDEDDDHPWLEHGCLDSRWIKSTTGTDRKKKFRDEDSTSLAMRSFTFRELKKATQNFHSKNYISEEWFWLVYKGVLPNGMKIAVKQLSSRNSLMEGRQEFINELGIVSTLNDHHPNVVKFIGCCTEKNQLLLIYEYMENGSLHNALFGQSGFDIYKSAGSAAGELKSRLNWETRFEICLGIAKGLAFLHEESTLKIIHRDIKLRSILLDKDLNAKISGFALAIHHNKEEALVTEVRGRNCLYMAPEYAIHGHLTYKADVYCFGVMMLEILSGKPSTYYRRNKRVFLLDRAGVLQLKNRILELIDPDLGMDYKVNQAKMMLNLAILCTNPAPAVRPKMSEVVSIHEGKIEQKSVPFLVHYSDDGFGKASASAIHEKEPLAGDDHAGIQEYDFEDAASTMQLHDQLYLMDEEEEEEEEEEEDNIAGVSDDFEGASSSSKVNNDRSIGDQTIKGGQKNDAKLLTERKFPVMSGPSESSNARKSWSSTTLFMDHVTKMNEEDKRKLEYVEPSFDEDGKLCIRYSEEEFEEGCNEWKDSLVGFFVGDDKPVIMNTILNKENVETLWGVKGEDAVFVFSMEDDYFLIRFKYVEDKIKVLESGPWHIENRPLILREWNWKLKFDNINEMKITLPIWVKMYNLPLFLWTSSYLSKVGSALGTPLYTDEKTMNKERVDFPRLCIQVDASKSLPNTLNISIKGVDYGIRFEYEWKPLRCAKMEGMKQN